MGQKLGAVSLWGSWVPFNTMWPEPRPTSVPSGILLSSGLATAIGSPSNTVTPGLRSVSLPSGNLIHPAICPQQTWAENWGGSCCAPLKDDMQRFFTKLIKVVSSCLLQYKPICVTNFDKLRCKMLKRRSLVVFFSIAILRKSSSYVTSYQDALVSFAFY